MIRKKIIVLHGMIIFIVLFSFSALAFEHKYRLQAPWAILEKSKGCYPPNVTLICLEKSCGNNCVNPVEYPELTDLIVPPTRIQLYNSECPRRCGDVNNEPCPPGCTIGDNCKKRDAITYPNAYDDSVAASYQPSLDRECILASLANWKQNLGYCKNIDGSVDPTQQHYPLFPPIGEHKLTAHFMSDFTIDVDSTAHPEECNLIETKDTGIWAQTKFAEQIAANRDRTGRLKLAYSKNYFATIEVLGTDAEAVSIVNADGSDGFLPGKVINISSELFQCCGFLLTVELHNALSDEVLKAQTYRLDDPEDNFVWDRFIEEIGPFLVQFMLPGSISASEVRLYLHTEKPVEACTKELRFPIEAYCGDGTYQPEIDGPCDYAIECLPEQGCDIANPGTWPPGFNPECTQDCTIPVKAKLFCVKLGTKSMECVEGSSPPQHDEDWPMYQHDVQHTGYNPSITIVPAMNMGPAWDKQVSNNGAVYAAPVTLGNTIFIASAEGWLRAFNTDDASLLWEAALSNDETPLYLSTTPAVSLSDTGNKIIATSRKHLFILDAEKGTLLDTYSSKGTFKSSPIVFNGKAYFGVFSPAPNIFAYDLLTGAVTEYSAPDVVIAKASVAIDPSSNTLIALDATGQLHGISLDGSRDPWVSRDLGNFDASPSISDGNVYIGNSEGTIHAVEVVSGETKWSWNDQSIPYRNKGILGTIGIAGDILVFANKLGRLYALDVRNNDQKVVWSHSLDQDVTLAGLTFKSATSPVVAGDTVYIASTWTGEDESDTGFMHALKLDSQDKEGELLWSYAFPDTSIVVEPVVDHNGNLYVLTSNGKLYKFPP